MCGEGETWACVGAANLVPTSTPQNSHSHRSPRRQRRHQGRPQASARAGLVLQREAGVAFGRVEQVLWGKEGWESVREEKKRRRDGVVAVGLPRSSLSLPPLPFPLPPLPSPLPPTLFSSYLASSLVVPHRQQGGRGDAVPRRGQQLQRPHAWVCGRVGVCMCAGGTLVHRIVCYQRPTVHGGVACGGSGGQN